MFTAGSSNSYLSANAAQIAGVYRTSMPGQAEVKRRITAGSRRAPAD